MKKRRQKTPPRITRDYLENAALYYLSRYASSSENLRRILQRKVIRSCRFHGEEISSHQETILDILQKHTETGLLNDAQYAKQKAETWRQQGQSSRAITQKLHAKGLNHADIQSVLGHLSFEEADAEEHSAAIRFARKRKIGPFRMQKNTDKKMALKEMAILARAGFSYEIIQKIFNQLPDDMDE